MIRRPLHAPVAVSAADPVAAAAADSAKDQEAQDLERDDYTAQIHHAWRHTPRKVRVRPRAVGGPKALWLYTYSDLITLVLAFFVLLFAMSSMDRSVVARISASARDVSFLTLRSSGRVPERVRVIRQLLEDPQEAARAKDRLRDLLLPDEALPPEVSREELARNMDILERDDGVAVVLNDRLLFASGELELSASAGPILEQLGFVLGLLTAPVVVGGHAGADENGGYELSAGRALTVLQALLGRGADPRRFSVAALGPDMPLALSPEHAADNRRVEILIRTRHRVGGY